MYEVIVKGDKKDELVAIFRKISQLEEINVSKNSKMVQIIYLKDQIKLINS